MSRHTVRHDVATAAVTTLGAVQLFMLLLPRPSCDDTVLPSLCNSLRTNDGDEAGNINPPAAAAGVAACCLFLTGHCFGFLFSRLTDVLQNQRPFGAVSEGRHGGGGLESWVRCGGPLYVEYPFGQAGPSNEPR